jgi:hypothetical protein|tara:strand:+ start:458 stop:589 length:132 start_codon:yes stop_codon:yes gene_type:complete
MIKFILGLVIGYVIVSVYGPEVVFTIWDGAANILNQFKEVNDI